MVKDKIKKGEEETLVDSAAHIYFRLYVKDLIETVCLAHYPDEAIVDLLKDSYFFIENYLGEARGKSPTK